MEENFFRSNAGQADNDVVLVKQKPSSVSGSTKILSNESGCFDCNICLDTAQDPIVTLCGHLFCWPCIYRWLHVKTSAVSNHQQQNCPVCKANISTSSLVPLYGRGMSSSDYGQTKQNPENILIPRRPTSSALNNWISSASTLNQNNQHQHQHQHQSHQQYFPHHYGGFTAMESSDLANAVMTSFLNPVIGMFGGMVCTPIFGTYTNTFTPHQNSYYSNNHRMRRQQMQLDKSLHRLSIFLLCCITLCLLLF